MQRRINYKNERERMIMKKWNKLTAVFAGIAVCFSLIGIPTGVQAQEDNNTVKASQPAVRQEQQTEENRLNYLCQMRESWMQIRSERRHPIMIWCIRRRRMESILSIR